MKKRIYKKFCYLLKIPCLLKLLFIGLPLLLAIVLFSWLVGFFRSPQQGAIPTQVVPPTA